VKNVVMFASGNGSNFQVIVEWLRANQGEVNIKLLVCDNPEAHVIKRAQSLGVPVLALNYKEFASKRDYEQAIAERLQAVETEFIVLAGYMRLLGPTLLGPYAGKIVNIHPSLLPAFPGKDAIGQALNYGVKITGVTIHFVDEGMDTGPIIYQEAVPVLPGDTHESLSTRVQQLEHKAYPKVVAQCLSGTVEGVCGCV